MVQTLNDKYNAVFIFGHNPGLTDFVNSIAETEVFIDNVPTSGVVAYAIPVDSWSDVNWRSGKLMFFDFPKNGSSLIMVREYIR